MTKAERIENGKIYMDNGYGTTYVFEIVDKIPACYDVWNIPELCGGEYAPFCMTTEPGNKNCFDVNIETLKAVKLSPEDSRILRKAASRGVHAIGQAKRTLARTAKSREMQRKQQLASAALPILERITA